MHAKIESYCVHRIKGKYTNSDVAEDTQQSRHISIEMYCIKILTVSIGEWKLTMYVICIAY